MFNHSNIHVHKDAELDKHNSATQKVHAERFGVVASLRIRLIKYLFIENFSVVDEYGQQHIDDAPQNPSNLRSIYGRRRTRRIQNEQTTMFPTQQRFEN